MELILLDERLQAYAASRDFDLDMAIGEDENDFTLTCRDGEPTPRGYVLIDGTEYGGIIDRSTVEVHGRTSTVKYYGRTWHGILDSKVIEPDEGQSHLRVWGDANRMLSGLVPRMGLTDVFDAPSTTCGIDVDYTFDRYTSGYLGIRKMLMSSGAKLKAAFDGTHVLLSAEKCEDFRDDVDSDLIDFDVVREHSAVNHLIGLGSGEGTARAVCHWYADAQGRVSQAQTLFGMDERTAVYDYNNAEIGELTEKTREKLQELQSQGSVSVDVLDGLDMDIGDTVSGRDNSSGITVTARIVKKIVTVKDGRLSTDYEVGAEKASKSLSGSAESSGGGHSYNAGRGLKLEGYTFSAEVDAADLQAVDSRAAEAVRTASDAVAAVGGKADASHTHDAGDITDGTLSSDRLGYVPASKLVGKIDDSHLPNYAAGNVSNGAALNALKLSNARAITLTGAVSGSASFDGSADITITTTGATSAGADFLAAHPVGSYFETESSTSPAAIGGRWTRIPSVGRAHLWRRDA